MSKSVKGVSKTEPNEKNTNKFKLTKNGGSVAKLNAENMQNQSSFSQTMKHRKSSVFPKNIDQQNTVSSFKKDNFMKKPYRVAIQGDKLEHNQSNLSTDQNDKQNFMYKKIDPKLSSMNNTQKKKLENSNKDLDFFNDLGQHTLGSDYEIKDGRLSSKPSQEFIVK